MIDEKIKEFLSTDFLVSRYREGVLALRESRIIPILRHLGMPQILDNGADTNVMATQAARAAGFQECLELLEYFIEHFNKPVNRTAAISADFGGTAAALKAGLITEKDLENRK